MLDVCLVLENPTDSVDSEGDEEVLDGDGNIWDDLRMISEVVGTVCERVNEVHPPKLEGGEELQWLQEQTRETRSHPLLHGLLAIRKLYH